MGVCCSKGAGIIVESGPDKKNKCRDGEAEAEDTNGGAVIRSSGSSKHVAMAIKQGKKGINQDAMTVWENFGGEEDMIFCGVFDGHGPAGHRISRHVCENLPSKVHTNIRSYKSGGNEAIESSSQSQEGLRGIEDVLVTFFKQIDSELGLDNPYESFCSGTTAVTVLKQGDCLVIANLGDSRAVLGTRGNKNNYKAVQLTVDLKPGVQCEAERIVSCNGRVFALKEEPEVYRVWMPDEDCPGLAMSRAFGDFCLKDYGLISIPEVVCRKVSTEDEFVVLATDGIWDVLSNEEVVKIVGSCKDRSMAAETLVQRAARTWRTKFPASKADDCAVVVLYLNHRPYPREGNVSRAISTLSWKSSKSNNECYGVGPWGALNLPQRVAY